MSRPVTTVFSASKSTLSRQTWTISDPNGWFPAARADAASSIVRSRCCSSTDSRAIDRTLARPVVSSGDLHCHVPALTPTPTSAWTQADRTRSRLLVQQRDGLVGDQARGRRAATRARRRRRRRTDPGLEIELVPQAARIAAPSSRSWWSSTSRSTRRRSRRARDRSSWPRSGCCLISSNSSSSSGPGFCRIGPGPKLADVVQEPADRQPAEARSREPELLADLDRERGDAAGVLLGRAVLLGQAHHERPHAGAEERLLGGHDLEVRRSPMSGRTGCRGAGRRRRRRRPGPIPTSSKRCPSHQPSSMYVSVSAPKTERARKARPTTTASPRSAG